MQPTEHLLTSRVDAGDCGRSEKKYAPSRTHSHYDLPPRLARF
jgi:hypothetical protein